MNRIDAVPRPHPGARAFCGACALLALFAHAGPAVAASADEIGPLPWRTAGRVGFTLDAAAFPDSGRSTLEVFVRVPPTTLEALTREDGGTSRLRVVTQLRSGYGSRRQESREEFELSASDSARGFGKVIVLRFPTRAGAQRLKVRLEDMYSRKRGLVYMGREVREAATVEGEFEIPSARDGREMSDIEFLWPARGAGDSSRVSIGSRRHFPNPERLYGLFASELRAAFVANSRDERPWRWAAHILDARGDTLARNGDSGPAGRRLAVEFDFDVSRQPAGGYDLEVEAWQEGDGQPLRRRSHFSVAWQPLSWVRNPRETQDLVHFLLRGEEEERFAALHPGEQERILEDFWRRRDPTPETALNEAREDFLRRVDLANERYGRFGLERGMFSDMGRVYIRYGEPSEILHQVIPTGDNTLLQVLQEIAYTEDRPTGQIQQKGPGGDMRPFEVWIYEGEIPLPPDADPLLERNARRRRLLFLFVDEQGLGDYRLRYSTE